MDIFQRALERLSSLFKIRQVQRGKKERVKSLPWNSNQSLCLQTSSQHAGLFYVITSIKILERKNMDSGNREKTTL